MDSTTIYDFHGRLLRDTFGPNIGDQDAFLLFTLFHEYQIVLAGRVLIDRPQLAEGSSIAAITQRGCAEALASVWAGSDDDRANYTYWYYRWNGEWGSYQHASNLSEAESARLAELAAQLNEHPFVKEFVPED